MKKESAPEKIKEIIKSELPEIMKTDEEIARFILLLSDQYYARKAETESRFDKILNELQRDREEHNRRWEENQKILLRVFEEIKGLSQKHDQTIGALGARWGINAESSFRNALAAILEKSFNVSVLHVTEFDDKGEVFGRPDQVELDLIIKDGIVIICEIKSSMSKSDVYTFEKKIKFYERLHNCITDRRIIISPMVDHRAKKVTEDLGFEVYSYADEVK